MGESFWSSMDQALSKVMRVLLLWLFGGDVTFALLPLLVMGVITVLVPGRGDFFLLKEWSFATIIFFGVSIRKLVFIKVRIQQNPRSHTLDTGVVFFVVFLVTAVLVLSLVILNEKGILPPDATPLLAHSQLLLFGLGLLSTLMAVITEDGGVGEP
jgi:hypothetical protein